MLFVTPQAQLLTFISRFASLCKTSSICLKSLTLPTAAIPVASPFQNSRPEIFPASFICLTSCSLCRFCQHLKLVIFMSNCPQEHVTIARLLVEFCSSLRLIHAFIIFFSFWLASLLACLTSFVLSWEHVTRATLCSNW